MTKILLFLGLITPFALQAQNTGLSGNWREVSRSDNKSHPIAYNDTIKIGFLPGGEYTWHKKNGFIYRGTYKIENGALDMGARYFTIVSRKSDRLVIKDEEATYEFRPYTEPARSRLAVEAPPLAVDNIREMAGKWSVFKRTSAVTQKDIDYTRLVETVVIYDSPDPDGSIGYVAAAKDPDNTHSWKIRKYENGILYCDGKDLRQFKASKVKGQLILEEAPYTYFFKQFK